MSKNITLSHRLQAAVRMVTQGNRVADIGCDHGFTSIYLVQQGISPRCLAMDVRTGPLSAASEHVAECGLEAYIETRLSDGLKEYRIGEADAMVCCGMGGPLMAGILEQSLDKALSFTELILQPQSEIPEFRVFLREKGFSIRQEDMVYEEGKYYFLIKAVPGGGTDSGEPDLQQVYDRFGRDNILNAHPVLVQYLEYCRNGIDKIRQQLTASGEQEARNQRRLTELQEEEKLIQQAEELMKGKND